MALHVQPGDDILAEHINRLADREVHGEDCYTDEFGTFIAGGGGDEGEGFVVRFQLKTAMTTAVGHATAYLLTAAGINTAVEFEVYDGYQDRYGWATTEAVQGAVGYAVYYSDSARWEIVSIQQLAEEIEVTLTADIAGNHATCTVDHYMRGRNPTGIADSDGSGVLYVYDPQDQFKRALSGAKAKATYDPVNNRYVLRVCQQMATMIMFLSESVAADANNINVLSDLKVMQPPNGQTPDPAVTSVVNTFKGIKAQSAGPAFAWWNEADETWQGMVLPVATLDVITDIQYNSTTNKFQKKTTEIQVFFTEDESGWTDMGGFNVVEKTVVDQIETTANSMRYHTVTLEVLGSTDGSWITIAGEGGDKIPPEALETVTQEVVTAVSVSGTTLTRSLSTLTVLEKVAGASGAYHTGSTCP